MLCFLKVERMSNCLSTHQHRKQVARPTRYKNFEQKGVACKQVFAICYRKIKASNEVHYFVSFIKYRYVISHFTWDQIIQHQGIFLEIQCRDLRANLVV